MQRAAMEEGMENGKTNFVHNGSWQVDGSLTGVARLGESERMQCYIFHFSDDAANGRLCHRWRLLQISAPGFMLRLEGALGTGRFGL